MGALFRYLARDFPGAREYNGMGTKALVLSTNHTMSYTTVWFYTI